jgi:hypothetical protein
MESAEKAAARKRTRLGGNGTILTKTMVLIVHVSTVYATISPYQPALPTFGALVTG